MELKLQFDRRLSRITRRLSKVFEIESNIDSFRGRDYRNLLMF